MATGGGLWRTDRLRALLRPGSTARAAVVAAVVAVALLSSAYALGRSLIPDRPRHSATGATGQLDGSHYADQPPADPTGPEQAGQEGSSASPSPTASDRAGDAVDETLFGAHVRTGDDRVALTFDDGPDPRYTPQVLAALRSHGVRATFCVVGEMAQSHPDLVQAIVADGHTLCNHSWNHDVTLGKRSPDQIRADLIRTNQAIRAAVPDAPIVWYRQPGGAWTYPVVSAARALGMAPLHWDVDPSDWEAPGARKIASTVLSQVGPGSIVLMHDAGGDRQGTVDALWQILPQLAARFELEALPTDTT
ncbi:polysaccharide deacetylase family protein [Micromonospora globbae]|uniref:Polysaccharide deacetylase family protein n=1 Tax=Micromonospora globbae TaxID=1894969 RepID=A0A420EZ71_9ACTN|nr:polysaccharide deacetylase family protein [Micromonospora globbae]RKF26014.1 polysaccharide deacetylase family protein [Micromonospora globbae]WTF85801.1 polysaccharide deacetylase family protein [Micromonospora globbae]